MGKLVWKMGFEIELLAPRGVTREDLAQRVAGRTGGSVKRFFHPQSEPSKVEGSPTFENLTLGYHVTGKDGVRCASFVDDLTLQADLDKMTPPVPGWYRVLADDGRMLRLAMRHCDATADASDVLDPLAALFGTEPQHHDGGMVRITDDRDISVAICAPLPGERERPCEIVTAPITKDHERIIGDLLADARALGFTLPHEGATHIHFDASPLCSAPVIAKIVQLFGSLGGEIKTLVGTNPNCSRLGSWPESLAMLTGSSRFQSLAWPEARAALDELSLSKYCDFNLLNIASASKDKHTFEVRVLPSVLEPDMILEAAALFEALLHWCVRATSRQSPVPKNLPLLIEQLPLSREDQALWLTRVRTD